jgi:hypothetical protein
MTGIQTGLPVQSGLKQRYQRGWDMAETTLLVLGLVMSTLDFTDLLLVGVEAFLTIDFFSIAIVVSPVFIECLCVLP